MKLADAIAQVLAEAGEPLRPKEIAQRIAAHGLWQTSGKTPDQTVHAQLATAIKRDGSASRFVRAAPGVYGLRDGGASAQPVAPTATRLSFTDAAEWVLRRSPGTDPLHYRQITKSAMDDGLLKSGGLTPEATMYVQLVGEIDRRAKRGDVQRFTRHPKGYFGLTAWRTAPVSAQVASHNRKVREEILKRLQALEAADFEKLIAVLLTRMGLRDVTETRATQLTAASTLEARSWWGMQSAPKSPCR